jgi:thioredoxin 1
MRGGDKMTDNDKVPELSNGEFNEFVKEGLVLVDFFAEWCMPCLMMAPVVDELSEKFKGKIKFGKVNIDDNRDLAQKFNVSSIPNFVLFRDGKPVEQFVGGIAEEEFEEKLKGFTNK